MPTQLALPGPSAAAACTVTMFVIASFLDLNRVKKGLNSYELNFSLPTNSQNKLTELN